MLSFLNEDYAKVVCLLNLSCRPCSCLFTGRTGAYARILQLSHPGAQKSRVCLNTLTQNVFTNYVCRRILTCLVPLRILRGHLPSKILSDRFPVLDELFSPFITAIRTGDITAYDTALDHWERRLVELNLWITIEKARELCIRGLFRRVYVFSHSLPFGWQC